MVEHIVQPVHATEHLQGAQPIHGKLQVCICIIHQLVHNSSTGNAGVDIDNQLHACGDVRGRQAGGHGICDLIASCHKGGHG